MNQSLERREVLATYSLPSGESALGLGDASPVGAEVVEVRASANGIQTDLANRAAALIDVGDGARKGSANASVELDLSRRSGDVEETGKRREGGNGADGRHF
jgi:hypothetical protein